MAVRSHGSSNEMPVSMTSRVVVAIADKIGVDPLQLDPPLYEVIDLDALEALFPAPDASGRSTVESLEFTYQDCRVLINGDASVEVLDCNRSQPSR